MNEYPSVSIIIPNFNGRPFIERCLRSVLRTGYPAFEAILVDNGSKDGGFEVIEKLFCNNSLIKNLQKAID